MAEVTRAYSNFAVPTLAPSYGGVDLGLSLKEEADGSAPLELSRAGGQDPAAWRITEEQRGVALGVFRRGGSVGDAARSAGMAWSSARALLTTEIERSGRQMPMWHAMTQPEINEAVRLRAQGWSYRRT